jgi:tRNA U55 pseudouridine synthase TruB
MTGLVRTAIGRFKLQHAIPSDELSYDSIAHAIRPPMEALDHLPSVSLTPRLIRDIAHGAILPAHPLSIDPAAETMVAVDDQHNLVALLTRFDGDKFKPTINFAQHSV